MHRPRPPQRPPPPLRPLPSQQQAAAAAAAAALAAAAAVARALRQLRQLRQLAWLWQTRHRCRAQRVASPPARPTGPHPRCPSPRWRPPPPWPRAVPRRGRAPQSRVRPSPPSSASSARATRREQEVPWAAPQRRLLLPAACQSSGLPRVSQAPCPLEKPRQRGRWQCSHRHSWPSWPPYLVSFLAQVPRAPCHCLVVAPQTQGPRAQRAPFPPPCQPSNWPSSLQASAVRRTAGIDVAPMPLTSVRGAPPRWRLARQPRAVSARRVCSLRLPALLTGAWTLAS